jgi:hypothetical protein
VYDLPSSWQKVPCGIRRDKIKIITRQEQTTTTDVSWCGGGRVTAPEISEVLGMTFVVGCWSQPVPYRFNRCMFKVPCHYVQWAPVNMQTCDHPLTVSVVPTQICNFLGQIWQWLATFENFWALGPRPLGDPGSIPGECIFIFLDFCIVFRFVS